MAEQVTTPDFSPAPRQRFEVVSVGGLPAAFLNPSVLYLKVTTTDGTCTIDFTPWVGSPVTGVPIFQQGKFDLTMVKSVQAVSGVSAMWRAY